MVTGDVAAQRWVAGLSGAGGKITDGINGVTVAPGQKAAAAKATWVQNTTAAADKFAKRAGAVPLEVWKQAAITKGVPRIGTGAQASQAKMASVMAKLLPAIASAVSTLPPRGTFEQNVQRSVQLMQKMHAQAGQFGA